LDGNVKRVLARFRAIEGWPGKTPVLATLWELAERYTPLTRVADYTQAMMDLGALVCTRSRPHCQKCPLMGDCIAHTQGRQTAFPAAKPRRQLPIRQTCMVMPRTLQGEILLEKRPPNGIWGGLWSFPECPLEGDVESWCRNYLGVQVMEIQPWSVIRHTFSHFHLDILPLRVAVKTPKLAVQEETRFVWYDTRHPDERGLAAPVKRLLTLLSSEF
jgi:A/G-specific adenine glycosylase